MEVRYLAAMPPKKKGMPTTAWSIELAKIKNAIYNPPATIVFWSDGTKTIVKCNEGDTYSKETGLLMCIAKKYFGNGGKFNDVLEEWCWSATEKQAKPKPPKHDFLYQESKQDEFNKIINDRFKNYDALCDLYIKLENWEIPDEFCKLLNMSQGLKYNFKHLPEETRCKIIAPLIEAVKNEIMCYVSVFPSELTRRARDYSLSEQYSKYKERF